MGIDYGPFREQVVAIIAMEDEPIPRKRLRLLKELCLTADKSIELSLGIDLPSYEVSSDLLEVMSTYVPAIDRLTPKIEVSDIGCWRLPLTAEYDSKNRARYPSVSDVEAGAKTELAHRFVMRVGLSATLGRFNFLDHMCRVHACCNPTHLDFVTPRENNMRSHLYKKTVDGQPRLI